MKENKHKKQSSSKAVNEKAGCKRPCKDTDQSPSIQGKTTFQPSYKEADKESKTGTRRKLPVCKSRSRRGTKKAIARENLAGSNAAPLVVPDSDDDDDVPLARRIRLFQQQPLPHDVKQADPVFKGNHNSHQEANTDLKNRSPHTPPTALVQLSDYDFDREFDISIVQCPEFEQVLNSVEQGRETNAIIMQPLQTVLPNKSSYHTLSPGRPSFSLSLTHLASFIDGVRPIYDGLSPSFGEDTRFFDKAVTAKRNWWLFPYCWRGDWWVYAFEVNAKRIVILGSLHYAPEDDKRDKLDAYVVRYWEIV
ncbi:uncharacterized protein LOC110269256 [Arachis ipaensis]|uniref:uncharacterized protein LOC110269256 n=1 Tax=Arachis ipaensis TaxID=130454 RepID=UPI000A2B8779|nr:uncharacterized protein LOC110269256 [Arachis ipaensis]